MAAAAVMKWLHFCITTDDHNRWVLVWIGVIGKCSVDGSMQVIFCGSLITLIYKIKQKNELLSDTVKAWPSAGIQLIPNR